MAKPPGESSAQKQPSSAKKLIKLVRDQGWTAEEEWDGARYVLEISGVTDEEGGVSEYSLIWESGRFVGKESTDTLKATTEFLSENPAVELLCDRCDDENDRPCISHAVTGSFLPQFGGWGEYGEADRGAMVVAVKRHITRNYDLADWESGPDLSDPECPGFSERYATGTERLEDAIPLEVREKALPIVPVPDMVGDCRMRDDTGFNGWCESYGVRLYDVAGRLMCGRHVQERTGIPVESLQAPAMDEEEQQYAEDLRADAERHRIFREAEAWAEEQIEAGRHVPDRGWEAFAEDHHSHVGADFLVTFRAFLAEHGWADEKWAQWAKVEPLAVGDIVELPQERGSWISPYSRILEFDGERALCQTTAYLFREKNEGCEWFSLADLKPASVPYFLVHGDRAYVDGKQITVDHLEDGRNTVRSCGGDRFPIESVTHERDMPEIVSEKLGKSWWRHEIQGRVFESLRLPDDVRPGGNINIDGLILENGELIGRGFNVARDKDIFWTVANPGFYEDFAGCYQNNFPPKPRDLMPIVPLSDEERTYIAAGPQPESPESPVQTPKRVLWESGMRVVWKGRQGRVRSVEMGGSPVRVAWDDNGMTSAVDAAELEQVTEGKAVAVAKGKAPKVGDIAFSGEKGKERAEILGHAYWISMLAGCYFVKHLASAVEILAGERSRPAMKRAILADAVARGAASELADPVTEFAAAVVEDEETPERVPLTYADLEGKTLGDFTTPEDLADLERLAGVWPVRWLFEGKRRAVNQFGGCGGWCVGIREILGADLDMVCIDLNADAVATSNAAGCKAIQADITTLDPEHPALRWTEFLISSPPCTDWTPAGKRLGHLPENLAILEEAINRAAWAAGNYEWGETGEDDEDHPDWDPEFPPHYGPPSGETWDEVRAITNAMTAPTARLMLEPVIWALALWRQGAPLHTVALEQSGALPEDVQEALSTELYSAGWECVDWADVDAARLGSPSHRRRRLMLASRYYHRRMPELPDLTTTADAATGLEPEAVIITRGARKTAGGNGFVMGRTIPGVTSKIRGWYKQDDPEFRFTLGQVAKLVSLPEDYPFTGSRTSACQQAADIVAPVVSAVVMGTLLGVPWLLSLERYLAEQYPHVHGKPEAPAPVEVRGPGQLHVWEDDGGAVSGVEPPCSQAPQDPRATMDFLPGEEVVAYRGGWHGEYEVTVPGGTYTYALRDLGESKRGTANNGWRYSLRCYTDGGRIGSDDVSPFTAVPYPADVMPAIRKHAAKRQKKPLLQQLREEIAETDAAGTAPSAKETLERYCGSDWKPLEATADPVFEGADEDEEPQPSQGLAQVSREQRAAAWRIASGEERPEPQAPEESDEARRVREFVERLRTADVVHQEQEAERDWFEPSAVPVADEEHQEEPQPDPLEQLRRELEELRADVETWGAEVAALAVAEAERVVAEVAEDMRAAELLELRQEAAAVRELLETPLEPLPTPLPTRARPWRVAWATAAAVGAFWSAAWAESLDAIRPVRL